MKTLSCLSIAIALLIIFPVGCSQDKTPVPVEGKPVNLSPRVAAQTSDFAFDLLRNLDGTEPAGDNIFVSPLSLHIALGMLLNGAEAETREGIIKTLKADESSVEELNNAYRTLLKELPEADSKVNLSIANSVWYLQGFSVRQNFQQVLSEIFDAQLYGEPFDMQTVEKINRWASDHTNGKIKQVINEISGDAIMFLMNALYFKGDWKYTFDKKQTQDWNFQLANGSDKKVKMMFVESDLRSYTGSDFTAVELPYSSGQFNLTLFVPAAGKDLNAILQDFDASKWDAIQSGMSVSGLKVGLPKFTLDYEIKLNDILSRMGMSRAFSSSAQFGAISDAALQVGFVKQNTFLGIDEEGTEAAAVTTIGMVLTSAGPGTPRTVIADRPFFFVISEKTSNTVLFTGRIMNP
ncbi:MAG: proteinase inhibitor I4 serpin [Cytophagaceae bacterium SCN 52-12]|nr:MAG: proteinase inhibitor I4 serpin [Cytophagaceae bacterium SCN 52-12]